MMLVSIGIGTVLAVALIVVVSILTGAKVTSNNGFTQSTLVGHHVNSFHLAGLDGGVVKAPWSEGHASVLIFFASWCGPCRGEMPKVARYMRTHNSSPIEVIGIDANDERTAAKNMVTHDDVTFPVAFDAHGQVTSSVFGFQTLPESVFVNAKGVVTNVYYGAIPKDQLATGLAELKSA